MQKRYDNIPCQGDYVFGNFLRYMKRRGDAEPVQVSDSNLTQTWLFTRGPAEGIVVNYHVREGDWDTAHFRLMGSSEEKIREAGRALGLEKIARLPR